MTTPAWWDDVRTPIAFLVAPLAYPLIFVLSTPGPVSDFGNALVMVIGTGLVYLITLMVGVPLYLLLRARGMTAFVLAPGVGLIVGTMAMAMVLLLGSTMTPGPLQFGAATGAAVGAVLWLIGRPDLQNTRP